jgi:hypothetical protein
MDANKFFKISLGVLLLSAAFAIAVVGVSMLMMNGGFCRG